MAFSGEGEPGTARSHARTGAWKNLVLFLVFAGLTVVWTYPLIVRMHTSIFGDPRWTFDSLAIMRAIWWMKRTCAAGLAMDFDRLVGYPFGVDLGRAAVSQPLSSYPTLLLALWKGEFFSYNFYVMASYVLSAVSMFCLAYYVTRDRAAGFFAGLIYSFAPNRALQSFSHMGLAGTQWMPLYVLALLLLYRERSYRSAVLCGLTFSLVTLSIYYHGYFMLLFTVGFVVFLLIRQWRRPVPGSGTAGTPAGAPARSGFKLAALACTIVAAAVLPFTYRVVMTTLAPSRSQEAASLQYIRPAGDFERYAARVTDYIAPSEYHPVWGKVDFWFIKPYDKPSRHWSERTLYLGVVPLGLAVYGVVAWRRRKRRRTGSGAGDSREGEDFVVPFLVFSAFLAFVFSLGPSVKVMGAHIPLPGALLYRVAPMFRALARLGAVVMLCVSVLAGLGVRGLLGRLRSAAGKTAVILCLAAVIIFEFTVIPPFRNADYSSVPPEYEWLALQPDGTVIAEYPWVSYTDQLHMDTYLFWQRVHGKPMVNGAPEWSISSRFRRRAEDIEEAGAAALLDYLGATHVFLHKDACRPGTLEKVTRNPGLHLVKEFPGSAVFEVAAQKPDLVQFLWKGFSRGERWSDGRSWRWAGDGALVWVGNSGAEQAPVDVSFSVLSFARERTLEVYLDDELIRSILVGAPGDPSQAPGVRIPGLLLEPGQNILRLSSPQGEDRIDDVLDNGDMRVVAFAFSDIVIEPAAGIREGGEQQ